jgi:hypothetical protein
MMEVKLSNGMAAIVDDSDFPAVSAFKWHAFKDGGRVYARARKNNRRFFMHSLIVGSNGGEIDHRNGDGLDNRRCNLRTVSHSLNQANRKASAGASKYKGVTWCKRKRLWQSRICVEGRSRWIGYFRDEMAAARAYDSAAIQAWGEYARPNFP